MNSINVKNFKGLAQNTAYEELSPEYSHTLVNLDCDNPVGKLKLRGGFTKKYADAFTDLISAYEYKFPKTGATILLFNDNGTLKYYTNGGSLTSLTLPTGAALASGFRNQYFGYKDHVLITTGNGSTNYVLGFYYLNRENDDNTGLFGNAKEFTGYKLLKSQLIPPHGIFSYIHNIVEFDGYYYCSFRRAPSGDYSKWIEKRDSNFKLVDRFLANSGAANYAEVVLASDSTYIYMAIDDQLYRINPVGWTVDENVTLGSSACHGIAVDDAQIYVATGTELYAYDKTDFASGTTSSDTSSFAGRGVAADPIGVSDHIWVLNASSIERRSKSAVGTVTHSTSVDAQYIHYDLGGDVYTTDRGAGNIKAFDVADVSLNNTYTHADSPSAMIEIGSTLYVIDRENGLIVNATSATIYRPHLMSFNLTSNTTGSMTTGSYFYKFSMVDVDGQEFTLSDPIFLSDSVNMSVDIKIIANEEQLNDLYRIQSINVYRAYNSVEEAEFPATNYKLLKTIDINDTAWANNATLGIYYYEFTDNETEANISSVTYEENTGFSENTKPRFVNYRAHEWIGNQLHCANFYTDNVTHKSKIAKSQVDAPDVVMFDNTYDFDPYDGDEILNITTTYSRAYVMKNRNTGIFYNDVLERRLGQGIADTDAYLTEVDTIYLLSDKGIFEVNGSSIRIVNDRVLTLFNSISSFTDANIFIRDDFQRVLFSVPGSFVLVWNRKYDIWTSYTSGYAFNGYFKNAANEYIGFGDNPNNASQYFHNLDDDPQDDGNNFTIAYDSPLLRLDSGDGMHSELTQLYYRQKSTGSFALFIYDWRRDSKTAALNYTIEDLTTISTVVKHISDVWGESFSFTITGNGTAFEFASLSLMFVPAGFAEEMHG